MRALTVDGRHAPRPLTAIRSAIRTDPSPGRPEPEPRPEILARDLSARPFGGAVARGATGRLLSTRPIAPVDVILGRVPARGGAATPRAPARLRAVVIARAWATVGRGVSPLFKKFTLGSPAVQPASCVRSGSLVISAEVLSLGFPPFEKASPRRHNRRRHGDAKQAPQDDRAHRRNDPPRRRRGEISILEAISEELPDVFNAEILSKLDLEAALNLAQVNKRYNDAVWSVDGVRAMKPIMEAWRIPRSPCGCLGKLGAKPMYFAARRSNVPAVRALLKSGVDIDEDVLEGDFTALQTAVAWQSPEVVKLLIDAGADVNKCDVDVSSPPLHLAAANGNASIAMLLIKAGAELNLADMAGETPLWIAVAEHNMPIVTMLVRSGADVDMKCEGMMELLRLAPSRNDATVLATILSGGPPDVEPRFSVGDRVECCIAADPEEWAPGTVISLWFRFPEWPAGEYAPYQIKLDDSEELIFAPEDHDNCIRLVG